MVVHVPGEYNKALKLGFPLVTAVIEQLGFTVMMTAPRGVWSGRSSLIRLYSVCSSVCIFWEHYSSVKLSCSNFRVITVNFLGVQICRIFTILPDTGRMANNADPEVYTVCWDLSVGFCPNNLGHISSGKYGKNPKISDIQKICCNHPKSWKRWLYHGVMCPKGADGMANSVDPDQIAPLRAVWSGSTQFDETCLSENLGSLR